MTARAVHWHEGMFLRPHHMQAAQRHGAYVANQSEKWDYHYNWGLRAIDLDLDAMANYRLVVRSLQARLRDGTLVQIPEDAELPALNLQNVFGRENELTVYLAVPTLHLGRANVSVDGKQVDARFRLDTQEFEDENTGLNPQPLQVRLLNVRLLLSTQDPGGFELLPIGRITKADRAEATPELDQTYIPPLLACDSWRVLQADIVQYIFDRVGKKLELLASQVTNRGITFDSLGQGDRLIFEQLRILNEVYTVLNVLAFAQGVHPLAIYCELCRVVGMMSIFGADRRPPQLLNYDHDNLGECFFLVKRHIDALLNIFVEPGYKERAFVGAGLRMQVTLEPSWLEPAWQMFVGVQSSLPSEDLVMLLTRPGQLDMKIGSSERVDEIFRLGQAGMKFAYNPQPPRALPNMPGLVYFQVDRQAQPQEWQNVQRSLSVAVRVNENRVAGSIQGQRVIKIKSGPHTANMQFTLYVVSKE